jgi:hypothetical protein
MIGRFEEIGGCSTLLLYGKTAEDSSLNSAGI